MLIFGNMNSKHILSWHNVVVTPRSHVNVTVPYGALSLRGIKWLKWPKTKKKHVQKQGLLKTDHIYKFRFYLKTYII